MTHVLDVSHLTKVFKTAGSEFRAVDDISFSVKEGEIVGLLGPNGAGKTTTIQLLLGLTSVTSGEIKFFGKSLFIHRTEILKRINFSSAYLTLPWRLTAWENLDVYGMLYEVPQHRAKIKHLAELFNAGAFITKKIQDLSAGQKTRIMLIKAFLNNPDFLLLDEPTASLDPDIARDIRNYLFEQQKSRTMTILITSHNMKEVEELCDRVIFLNHGKIYAIDTPESLAQRDATSKLELMVTDGLKKLKDLAAKKHIEFTETNRFITLTLPEESIGSFLAEIGKQGVVYSDIEIVKPSLEDFFLSVGRGEGTV